MDSTWQCVEMNEVDALHTFVFLLVKIGIWDEAMKASEICIHTQWIEIYLKNRISSQYVW